MSQIMRQRPQELKLSPRLNTKSLTEMLSGICKVLIGMSVIMTLTGCAPSKTLLTPPIPSADLLTEPCKASDSGKNSDDELQSDIETLKCLAELRADKYRWQAFYKSTRAGMITKH